MKAHDGDLPTLYAIRSCDTCRQARQWLDAHGIEHRVHDLRDDGVNIQMLERWADHVDWRELLNTRSLTWRKLPEVDRSNMSLSRALAVMLDQPTLVKRPVLEHGGGIEVGFSPARYAQLFAKK
jgi:arsenate reductase (glutaredoxin)